MATVIYILLGLTLTLTLSHAMDDPVPYLCRPICIEQDQAYDRCINEKACYDLNGGQFNDDTMACIESCWAPTPNCHGICRENYNRIVDECDQHCRSREDYSCLQDCFQEKWAEVYPGVHYN